MVNAQPLPTSRTSPAAAALLASRASAVAAAAAETLLWQEYTDAKKEAGRRRRSMPCIDDVASAGFVSGATAAAATTHRPGRDPGWEVPPFALPPSLDHALESVSEEPSVGRDSGCLPIDDREGCEPLADAEFNARMHGSAYDGRREGANEACGGLRENAHGHDARSEGCHDGSWGNAADGNYDGWLRAPEAYHGFRDDNHSELGHSWDVDINRRHHGSGRVPELFFDSARERATSFMQAQPWEEDSSGDEEPDFPMLGLEFGRRRRSL